MLAIFVIEITFASSQEAINKVQEVSKINISERSSFRASMPLSLQVPRRDSRRANNFPLWLKEFGTFDCRFEIYVKLSP